MDYPLFAAHAQHAYPQYGGEMGSFAPQMVMDSTHSSPNEMDPSGATFFDYGGYTFDENTNLNMHHPNSHGSPVMNGSIDSGIGMEMERKSSAANPGTPNIDGYNGRRRSSSEEKDKGNSTPAKTRRQAQNRAAQRAFRERKERHVKDLESKLTALEEASHTLQSDNERLKLALQRAETENEILRATAATHPNSLPPSPNPKDGVTDQMLANGEAVIGPQHFTPSDMQMRLEQAATQALNDSGRPVPGGGPPAAWLPASATWDLIMSHPLFKQGRVDIGDVCDRLKRLARCDGHGPVFKESDVIRVVEGARRAGGDELI